MVEAGSEPTNARRLLRAGLAAPVVLALAIVVAGRFEPGYSHVSQYVSELGAVGASHAKAFSYGGLLPAGLLTVLFAVGMYLQAGASRSFVASSLLAGVAGLGRMAAAVFPCDAGCSLENMSMAATLHAWAGFLALTSGAVAPLVLATGLRRRPRSRLFALSVGLGLASLVLALIMFGPGREQSFVGVVQRLLLAAFYAWVIAVVVHAGTRTGDLRREGQP